MSVKLWTDFYCIIIYSLTSKNANTAYLFVDDDCGQGQNVLVDHANCLNRTAFLTASDHYPVALFINFGFRFDVVVFIVCQIQLSFNFSIIHCTYLCVSLSPWLCRLGPGSLQTLKRRYWSCFYRGMKTQLSASICQQFFALSSSCLN